MRLPRRRFLVAFLLVIAVGLFFHFSVFYHLKGWIRGDAYYKGLPTCYWADAINDGYGRPDWLKEVYRFAHFSSPRLIAENELFCKDPQAAPVLGQLAADSSNSPEVRRQAIECLDYWHLAHPPAEMSQVYSAIVANEREDPLLRESAAFALRALGEKGKDPNIDLSFLLQAKGVRVKLLAASVLWAQGCKVEEAGTVLVNAIATPNPGTPAAFLEGHKQLAMQTLESLGPVATMPFLVRMTHHADLQVDLTAARGLETCMKKALEQDKISPAIEDHLQAAADRLNDLSLSANAEIRETATRTLASLRKIRK